jgi:hypothetical protein
MPLYNPPAAISDAEAKLVNLIAFLVSQGIYCDSFNRADNALTLSNTDTEQAWSVLLGVFGISGNQAYCISLGYAVIDTGLADSVSSCDFPVVNGIDVVGIAFRLTDALNTMRVNTTNVGGVYKWVLTRRVAGVNTVIAQYDTAQNNDEISIHALGNVITVNINGVDMPPVVEEFNISATKVGVYVGGSSSYAARFDDFKVVAL